MSRRILAALIGGLFVAGGLTAWRWWSDNRTTSLPAIPLASGAAAAAAAPRPPQTRPAAPVSREPTLADKVPQAEFDETVKLLDDADPALRNAAATRVDNWPGDAYERSKAAADNATTGPKAKVVLHGALPRLRLRQQKLARAREAYEHDLNLALGVYGKQPAKPAADQAARATISLGLKPPGLREAGEDDRAVADLAQTAFYLGCEDPLVNWIGACAMARLRVAEWSYRGPAASYVVAAKALEACAYPAEIKALALAATLRDLVRERREKQRREEDLDQEDIEDLEVLSRMLESCIPAVMKEPLHEETIYHRALAIYQPLQEVLGCDEAIRPFKAAYLAPGARPASDVGPRNLMGAHLIEYAWEARGSGVAATVTPEGWRLFAERLGQAEKVLTSVWAERPDDGRSPRWMIIVAKGHSTAVPARTWFDRAMACDPDDLMACKYYVETLYPRWGGSHQQLLQFGRECLATGNWRADLPSMLIAVHAEIGRDEIHRAIYSSTQPDYFQRAPVWADHQAYYEGYLKLFPEGRLHLSQYARAACEAMQWSEAAGLFARIGDVPEPNVFGSQGEFESSRRRAQTGGTGRGRAPATR